MSSELLPSHIPRLPLRAMPLNCQTRLPHLLPTVQRTALVKLFERYMVSKLSITR